MKRPGNQTWTTCHESTNLLHAVFGMDFSSLSGSSFEICGFRAASSHLTLCSIVKRLGVLLGSNSGHQRTCGLWVIDPGLYVAVALQPTSQLLASREKLVLGPVQLSSLFQGLTWELPPPELKPHCPRHKETLSSKIANPPSG